MSYIAYCLRGMAISESRARLRRTPDVRFLAVGRCTDGPGHGSPRQRQRTGAYASYDRGCPSRPDLRPDGHLALWRWWYLHYRAERRFRDLARPWPLELGREQAAVHQ